MRGRLDYRPDTLAWHLHERTLYTVQGNRQRTLDFDALVLCTGAGDRLLPVPGWNLAGTYTLGGAQIALKAQAVSIGRRVIFLGSGPLLYLVAAQYQQAGATVAAVLDTAPLRLRAQATPKLLARPGVAWKGVQLMASLKRAGVPLHFGVTPLEILGDAEQGVRGVAFADARGLRQEVAGDAVGLGYHLRPETQLGDLARCAFEFERATGQWVLQLDADGRTSTPGVYAAGDGARVRGADGAELAGQLAACAVLSDLGRTPPAGLAERCREAGLPDTAVVCRCEGITAGELRAVVREKGAQEANRAKAFSRVGMGRCQGRYCAQAGAEIIAAESGVPVEAVGRLRGQAPVRPLPLGIVSSEGELSS